MKEKDIIRRANALVFDYTMEQTKEALGRAEMEMRGEGCPCPSCKKEAVDTVNSWLAFLFKGKREILDDIEFGLEKTPTGANITPPKIWKRQGKV